MENITKAQKNKMAIQFGLILGIIYIAITSGINMTVGNWMMYYLVRTIGYIVYFLILGFLASRIKKANGGFIEFRELFGAVFIMLLIGGAISYIYSLIYFQVIDPDLMDKLKNSMVIFMEKNKVPDEKIEEAVKKFDQQVDQAKNIRIGNALMGFVQSLLMDCLFGLLVCLAVKKPRPLVMPQ